MDKNEITLLIDSLNGNRNFPIDPEAAIGMTLEQFIKTNGNFVFLMNDALVRDMVSKQHEYDPNFVPATTLDEINNGLMGTFHGVNVYSTWVYRAPGDLPADAKPRFGMYRADLKQIFPLTKHFIVK
ncbi:hypothetical protein pEaSNUABM34_00016 [Erwinia phage pEa_SNUABM_34]|uniref:Uncharacterized protein n=1 Tax=Erwinia phage pEa_SNUABM_7 TaxID=2866695 RepID=A0AAE7WSK4_9CAUD|nr:hypothetical protein MPK74_gp016 [Erwinia phage pEa_SNUABM_7]QYW03318.1 hypothetical protein pEaSNUABM34_00016 [Erwinia phage pEa_SNUABM_34]QYW04684.1 hypothetical protein pEaSNUABM7_00016 [Erwinia phage pEa_SNUABM_7]QYW05030.1 hypothetical protein pEaSNUABM21_00016 [Erwinia phage pEa_SNUABM_21]